MYGTFDGPSGEKCVARRDVSNTPLQALTLLNGAVFMEAARELGRLAAARDGSSVDERVVWLFRRCLTRPPEVSEREDLVRFYDHVLKRFRDGGGALNAGEFSGSRPAKTTDSSATDSGAANAAAWTAVARVILNLDETISKR